MQQNCISKAANNLQALLDCYLYLSEWSEGNKTGKSGHGKLAIYARMRSILEDESIYPIIAAESSYVLEDYIYHVEDDTPGFIEKIRKAAGM